MRGDLIALTRMVFLSDERMFVFSCYCSESSVIFVLVNCGEGKTGQCVPSSAVLLLSSVCYL